MSPSVVQARVEAITPLTDSIVQLILVPDQYVDYEAGQYLNILLGKEEYSYSIANAPLGARHYELHLRHSPDNIHAQHVLAQIKQEGSVTLKLPLGLCSIQRLDPQRPILFLVRGTGFAPAKAMIEQLLADSDPRLFELFWGARSKSDLYLDDMATRWQKHVSHFKYCSTFPHEDHETLISAVLARYDHEVLNKSQIVMSGPFNMVYYIRDVLLDHGVASTYLFSDAFETEQGG